MRPEKELDLSGGFADVDVHGGMGLSWRLMWTEVVGGDLMSVEGGKYWMCRKGVDVRGLCGKV